jgi:hypothetical protein
MRGRTSKLLRTYCGLRAREGAPVFLRDMKRRYRSIPWTRRAAILDGMAAYLRASGNDLAGLRRNKARVTKVKGKTKAGILSMLASLIGMR